MDYPDNVSISINTSNTYEQETFEKACALFVKRVEKASRMCKATQIVHEKYWKYPCVVWLEVEASGKDEFGQIRFSIKIDADDEQKKGATDRYVVESSYCEKHFSRGNGVGTYSYVSTTKCRNIEYVIRYGAEKVDRGNYTSQYKASALNGLFKDAFGEAFESSFFSFRPEKVSEAE